MGTKTIRITEEVYERLKARKRDDESFTELLDRLTTERTDFEVGFGAWRGTDKGERVRTVRSELNEDLAERIGTNQTDTSEESDT